MASLQPVDEKSKTEKLIVLTPNDVSAQENSFTKINVIF